MTAVELHDTDPTEGCSVCGSPDTVTLDSRHGRRCAACPPPLAVEQVDPLAAFRLARAWFAWHADERFLAAAERLAS
jgi:hypothetical protein